MATYSGSQTIYDYLKQDIPDGDHVFETNFNGEIVNINVEVVNFYDDVHYTSSPILGNATPDERMLVLKYHGNLTIDAGVTLTPQVRKRGMFVYIVGKLINNGLITMTARGAIAPGQNVFIEKDKDGIVFTIPAISGTGGAPRITAADHQRLPGNHGNSGILGGGGSGACFTGTLSGTAQSGGGGTATSYSGGAGGGGISTRVGAILSPGSSEGGVGGNAYANRSGSSWKYGTGGGAGNPGGNGSSSGTTGYAGDTGTGGLLIVLAKHIENNGAFEAKGSAGGRTTGGNDSLGAGGGGSGGGSVNVLYERSFINTGTVSVEGGPGGKGVQDGVDDAVAYGGKGGDGSFNIIPLYQKKYLFQDGTEIKRCEANPLALRFDGAGDRIDFSDPIIPTGSKTIKFMFRKDGIPTGTGYERIFCTGLTTENAIQCYVHSDAHQTQPGAILFSVFDQGSGGVWAQRVGSAGTIDNVCDNQWHEIKAVFDLSKGVLEVYVDGLLKNSTTYPLEGKSEPASWSRNLLIGAQYTVTAGTYTTFFDGDLDDLQILDENGVKIHEWKLNDNGSIIHPSVGQHSGNLTGGTWIQDPKEKFHWLTVGSAPVTKTMFDTHGMTDLSIIDNNAIEQLTSDTPELLCWTNEEGDSASRSLNMTAIPKAKLVLPVEDLTVGEVESFNLSAILSGEGDIKVLVSGDSGVTWKGNGMVTVDPADLAAVKTNGLTPDQINTLTKIDWQSLIPNGKVRFAFYLEQDKTTDVVQIDKLTVNEKVYTMTPSIANLSVLYDLLKSESPDYYISRDDGVNWKKVEPDILTKLDDLPSGKALRIKVVLKNGQELHGLSYSWI